MVVPDFLCGIQCGQNKQAQEYNRMPAGLKSTKAVNCMTLIGVLMRLPPLRRNRSAAMLCRPPIKEFTVTRNAR
jgi:hypothetical protein